MNAELKAQLQTVVIEFEKHQNESEDCKKLQALMDSQPTVKAMVEYGKLLGFYELAKKVLETPCDCGCHNG